MTRPTTIRAMTEIPAKTPRPIGSTASFFPGRLTAAFDVSAGTAVALEAALAVDVVLGASDEISAAAEGVLVASDVFSATAEVLDASDVVSAPARVEVPGDELVWVGDVTDVEVIGVTVETGYISLSTKIA